MFQSLIDLADRILFKMLILTLWRQLCLQCVTSQEWRQVSSEGGVGGAGEGIAADPNIVSISFANKLDLPHF